MIKVYCYAASDLLRMGGGFYGHFIILPACSLQKPLSKCREVGTSAGRNAPNPTDQSEAWKNLPEASY